jgi:hypothetical protein
MRALVGYSSATATTLQAHDHRILELANRLRADGVMSLQDVHTATFPGLTVRIRSAMLYAPGRHLVLSILTAEFGTSWLTASAP